MNKESAAIQLFPELQTLLGSMQVDNVYLSALTTKSEISQTRLSLLQKKTPQKIASFLVSKKAQKAIIMAEDSTEASAEQFQWRGKESMVFEWLVMCYCYQHHLPLHSKSESLINFLKQSFPDKSVVLLKYHLASISRNSRQKHQWNGQDIQFLYEAMEHKKNEKTNRWSKVALDMFGRSKGKCFKLPNNCRQTWQNYLNPELSKDQWTLQEDLLLIETIKGLGKKWGIVAQRFKGRRNSHMVKNRYIQLTRIFIDESLRQDEEYVASALFELVIDKMRDSQRQKQQFLVKQQDPGFDEEPLVKIENNFESQVKQQFEE